MAFLYEKIDALREYGSSAVLPSYIPENLNPNFELRPYQKQAFENFITHFESSNRPKPTQVLFHMATGSGKTLIMAGLMLYLYKSGFVKLVVIFCNNEDKGEHFMSTRKTIGGALGAIIVLIVAQILAQLVASLFVLVKIPEGICNIIAGIIYVGLAFVLSELFSKRLLKIKIENLGMPKFSIKAKWIIVGVLLPVIVKAVYLFFFSGKYVSSGMNSNQIFSTLSAGIAFTGIAAGFVEEMVFRGVILNLLKEKWNIKVAVLIPSVLFGLVHIIGMDFSIISSLLVLIAGTMVGIMFSMVAIESGSVWNSGIVHSLWNILIIGGGLSISEKADEYSVMTYVLDSKDFVFTGGEFGIESSIIALLGYVIVTLAAICMIKKKAKV